MTQIKLKLTTIIIASIRVTVEIFVAKKIEKLNVKCWK